MHRKIFPILFLCFGFFVNAESSFAKEPDEIRYTLLSTQVNPVIVKDSSVLITEALEYTFGTQLEFRFPGLKGFFGLGFFASGPTDYPTSVAGMMVFMHPWRGLKLGAGGGLQFVDQTLGMGIRGNLGYDFFVLKYLFVGPNLDVLMAGSSLYASLGVSLGLGF